MRQMLTRADVSQVWSERVCEEVADRVVDQFGNADGSINFEEWLSLMRECASQHSVESPRRRRTNSNAEIDLACLSSVAGAVGGDSPESIPWSPSTSPG